MQMSNKLFGVLVVLLVAFVPWQMAFGTDLDISGFFDVTSTYQNSQTDENEFGLGQAELDIAKQLSRNANIAVAVAYNNEERAFDLGSAVLDLNLYTNDRSFVSSIDLAAGQFYVPFGIDNNWYASIDRKLVTPPLAVVMTHGGWNDMGFKFSVASNSANLVVFGVNGFESSFEVATAAQALATGVVVGEVINTTPAQAIGGRLGVVPTSGLEIGGSAAVGLNESDKDEMLLMGADVQLSIQRFEFKGEYISHSLNRSLTEETNQGYYFQAGYNFDRVFLIGRYGAIEPEGMDWYKKYTLGTGYIITNGVQVRFESTINDNSDDNTNILQLVAGF